MLKLAKMGESIAPEFQPPSGGCVLKRESPCRAQGAFHPAAFGRLCVETFCCGIGRGRGLPAAFGRLCVETGVAYVINVCDPASRLRAAVC